MYIKNSIFNSHGKQVRSCVWIGAKKLGCHWELGSLRVLDLSCLNHICLICFVVLCMFQMVSFALCLMTKDCSMAMNLILKNHFLIWVYLDLQIHTGRECCKRQRKVQLQVKGKSGSKCVVIVSLRSILRDITRKVAWRNTKILECLIQSVWIFCSGQ